VPARAGLAGNRHATGGLTPDGTGPRDMRRPRHSLVVREGGRGCPLPAVRSRSAGWLARVCRCGWAARTRSRSRGPRSLAVVCRGWPKPLIRGGGSRGAPVLGLANAAATRWAAWGPAPVLGLAAAGGRRVARNRIRYLVARHRVGVCRPRPEAAFPAGRSATVRCAGGGVVWEHRWLRPVRREIGRA